MYNTKNRISIARVVEKIYRDYGFNTDIVWSDVIEWLAEGINLLGVEPSYEDKISSAIELTNGRGELPCDIAYIRMVRDFDTQMVFVRSSDQFHLSNYYRCEDEEVSNNCYPENLTYICENGYIFTPIKEGNLEIAYKAIPTDKEGLPTIPDDDKYIRAMSSYIAERIAFKLYLQDKLTRDKFQMIERDRDWAFGSAKMKMIIPDIDAMESMKRQMLRLIPTINHHSSAFKGASSPQVQKNHNSY